MPAHVAWPRPFSLGRSLLVAGAARTVVWCGVVWGERMCPRVRRWPWTSQQPPGWGWVPRSQRSLPTECSTSAPPDVVTRHPVRLRPTRRPRPTMDGQCGIPGDSTQVRLISRQPSNVKAPSGPCVPTDLKWAPSPFHGPTLVCLQHRLNAPNNVPDGLNPPMERFNVRPARVLKMGHCDFGGVDVWFT